MTSIPLFIGVLFACVFVGAVPALVNALKPRLQQLLNLDQERVERLERMNFFLAWIAGMPLAGYLADEHAKHEVEQDERVVTPQPVEVLEVRSLLGEQLRGEHERALSVPDLAQALR